MKRTARQRRVEAATRIRMLKGCKRCGAKPPSREYVKAWQFHHTDATTKVGNIADLYGRANEIFFAELRKVEIYCATCHIMEHVDLDNLGKRRVDH